MLFNEFIKLRRAHVAIVPLAIPLIAVVFGAGNYAANSGALDSGWHSYWSQATLFYGMLFMVAGIAILASAVWRVEHRGGNWNILLTSSQSAASLITAKFAVIVALTVLMQCVFILFSTIGGWVAGLSGLPPRALLASTLLAVIPATAVAAWQSFASMVIRNFAMPVALGVMASILSFGTIAAGVPAAQFVLPPVGVTKALWMGSTAVAGSDALDLGTLASIAPSALLLTAAGWLASIAYLRFVDMQA